MPSSYENVTSPSLTAVPSSLTATLGVIVIISPYLAFIGVSLVNVNVVSFAPAGGSTPTYIVIVSLLIVPNEEVAEYSAYTS